MCNISSFNVDIDNVQIVLTEWSDCTVCGISEWTCWGCKHFTAEWSTCWCRKRGKFGILTCCWLNSVYSWKQHVHSWTWLYIWPNFHIWIGQVNSSDDSVSQWTCWCSQCVTTTWSKCTLTEQGEVVAVRDIFHLLDPMVTLKGTPSMCCTDYYKKGILLHTVMVLFAHKSHQTDPELDLSTAQVVHSVTDYWTLPKIEANVEQWASQAFSIAGPVYTFIRQEAGFQ